jgi:hypothetical protein
MSSNSLTFIVVVPDEAAPAEEALVPVRQLLFSSSKKRDSGQVGGFQIIINAPGVVVEKKCHAKKSNLTAN